MSGKEIRLSKLFNPKSGKSMIIPIDHGIVMGNPEGLEDPVKVLEKLVELKIDGVLIGVGLTKITSHLFKGKDAPARILTVDFPMMSTIPGEIGDIIDYEITSSVEFALKWDFNAIKVLFPWGLEKDVQMKVVKTTAYFAQECDKWGMPLMVEPVLMGNMIPVEKKKDPSMIEHASRIALELGADILKVPYTGEIERFSEFVKRIHLPVVILGGPKMDSVSDILRVAKESMLAGAKGTVFGRNVWQNPNMEKLIKALEDIVHRDEEVERTMKKYGL